LSTAAPGWRLPTSQMALFGGLVMPFALMQGPGIAILPNMYAQSFGIALTEISLALLISRLLFDALGSLLIGALSDRTRSRFGRRKPWLVAGAMLGIFGIVQLYAPEGRPGAWHLAIWMSIVYLAWNMFEVPYTAWSNELARGYEDRVRINLWRQGFQIAGVLVMAWLPFLVSANSEVDWDVLRWVTWVTAVSMPLVLLVALRSLPQGVVIEDRVRLGWRQALTAVAANRPFAVFLGFTVLLQVAAGMSGALFFLFYTTHLGLGSWFGMFITITTAVSLAALPLWMRLIERTSKNRMLLVACTGFALTLPAVHFMSPGPLALPMYAAYDALWILWYGGIEVASRAMLGDVADYGTLKTRRERMGEYVAIWTLVVRSTQALAAALAFAVAGWYGYEPAAGTQDASAIFGLQLSLGGIPMLFAVAAAAVCLALPLTRARHEIVRRRLERLSQRRA
jgi:glycoside/pentoside/hexuronide:cation symporter, GPH family